MTRKQSGLLGCPSGDGDGVRGTSVCARAWAPTRARATLGATLLCSLVLAAGCSKPKDAVSPPIANAGLGRVVPLGTLVTLDGSGSRSADDEGAEGLTFAWSTVAIPAGSQAALSDTTTVGPSFTVDAVGEYIFRLVVQSAGLESRPAVVVIEGYRPLAVEQQSPPDTADDVATNAPVVVFFSEPVQPDSVHAGSFQVLLDRQLVSGNVSTSEDLMAAVFEPASPYPAGATIEVAVTQELAALSGRTLATRYEAHFTVASSGDTTRPSIIGADPEPGAQGVALSQVIAVTFSEPVAEATLDSTSFALTSPSGAVPAEVTLVAAGTRALLMPQALLTPNTAYTLSLTTAVTDRSGNPLDGDGAGGAYSAQFTTAAAADTAAPLVVSVYPGQLYEQVPTGANLRVTFSRAMAPDSATADSVTLMAGSATVACTRSWSLGNRVLTVSPSTALAASTQHSLTLRGSGAAVLRDSAGTALDGNGDGAAGGDYASTFTTTSSPSHDGVFTVPDEVAPGGAILVRLNDRDLDLSVARDTTTITATTSRGDAESISLTETASTSGVFEASATTVYDASAGVAGDSVLSLLPGDTVTFAYHDQRSAAGVEYVFVATVPVRVAAAAILTSAVSGSTTEASGTASFTIVLATPPSASVTVSFDVDDSSEATASVTSVTFTTANWNVPQTVTLTGVDDFVIDGDQSYAVVFSGVTSADTAYAALSPASVPATNLDNDVAGFVVTNASGSTSESGGTATFTVALRCQPESDVIVALSSSDTTEGTIAVTSLTFTADDWDTPQTVTVTGQNDDQSDGDIDYTIDFGAADSADTNFDGLTPTSVDLANVDNDTAGFYVSAISGNTSEAGGTATFTVELRTLPTADVSISLSSGSPLEGTPSPTSLTFTTGNWDTPQTVTVTGVDDLVDDGDKSYQINFGTASSTDPKYSGITPSSVSVVNVDNDTAGFTLSAASGPTTGVGGTATFTIALTAAPTVNIILDVQSSDESEGTVDPAFVQFTAANWSTPQTITVAGANDGDGNQSYKVTCVLQATSDPAYNALRSLPAPEVAFTNIEVGTSGGADIVQTAFLTGHGLLVRVMGDTDVIANPHAGAGNDTLAVTLTTALGDSETMLLAESTTTEGTFDCTYGGCLIFSKNSATATSDNGVLELNDSGTVTLTYTDAIRADRTSGDTTDTASGFSPSCVSIVINEVVTDPQQDWDDSAGGDSTPFNGSPGTAAADDQDEWIELYNKGCTMNLTGYTLEMVDGSSSTFTFGGAVDGQTLVFSAGGSVASFQAGEYLVIGRPAGSGNMEDDIWVRLRVAAGGVVDSVTLGSSPGGDGDTSNNAPSGNASGTGDEAVARSPNGADTDSDDADFAAGSASIGAATP